LFKRVFEEAAGVEDVLFDEIAYCFALRYEGFADGPMLI
jgi:hypothetical protein